MEKMFMKGLRFEKLTRGDLNLTLEEFLKKFGAVRGTDAYPGSCYISDEDAAVLRRNNRRKFRKEYPRLPKRKIDSSIAGYWLNFGPCELLGKIIKPGYLMVDVSEIDKEARERLIKVEVTPTLSERLAELCRKLELGGFGKK